MSKKLNNIEVGLDEDLEEKLQWLSPGYENYHILKKSVDARSRNNIKHVYSVQTFDQGEDFEKKEIHLDALTSYNERPVLIIGAGPAGLFAALRLIERGIKCKLIEQGEPTEKRILSIAKFWRKGLLNEDSNVGFGEGGAGLFSDGKLITRIKSPHIPYVMQRLVKFGAPAEIEYLANPHVGSDKIRRVIPKLRAYLLEQGCEMLFNTKVCELIFEGSRVCGVKTKNTKASDEDSKSLKEHRSDHVILATGHSSKIFDHLKSSEVFMEGKSFAMGFRIEHPQEKINKIQYKDQYAHPKLKAANYKLAHTSDGIGVYSFCMCPGGYVLSSGTANGQLVANGMSNYNRNSPFANAAIVLSIDHEKNFKGNLFGGLEYRDNIEKEAFKMIESQGGVRELPAQRLQDFLNKKVSEDLPKSSTTSGVLPGPLHELFDKKFHVKFQEAIEVFNRKMRGFNAHDALLIGVESRTSCPVRITRDSGSLQSLSHKGLYPTGEGAGYAGGITSAACDGIAVAEKIFDQFL